MIKDIEQYSSTLVQSLDVNLSVSDFFKKNVLYEVALVCNDSLLQFLADKLDSSRWHLMRYCLLERLGKDVEIVERLSLEQCCRNLPFVVSYSHCTFFNACQHA